MVCSKAPPRHAEVRPLKCVVYMTRNPVTFEIHRRHEYLHTGPVSTRDKIPSRVQEACPHAACATCNSHSDQGRY